MAQNRNRGGQQERESVQQGNTNRGGHAGDARQRDNAADTSRTSNQGRKEASGGSAETNNQGRPKGK